jgi:hypothetical protein
VRVHEGKTERGLLRGMESLTVEKKKWSGQQILARKGKVILKETEGWVGDQLESSWDQ